MEVIVAQTANLEFALASLATLVAGVARGLLGFGATLIVVPFLVSIYGPVEAAVVASVIEIPAILSLLPTAVRQANWRHVAPLGLSALLTIPVGAWLLVSMDPKLSRDIIGAIVIVFAALLATGWRYPGEPSLTMKLLVGAGSGVTSGLANIGGPLVVVFLVASRTAAIGVRAGIMAFFSMTGVYRIGVYAVSGIYAMPFLVVAAALCVPYLLGIWIGTRLFTRVSERLFFRAAIGLVITAGVVALLD